jgi:hypothetical protein
MIIFQQKSVEEAFLLTLEDQYFFGLREKRGGEMKKTTFNLVLTD